MTTTPTQFCKKHKACEEGAEWAGQFSDMQSLWLACERSDWMMWMLGKVLGCKHLVGIAAHIVEMTPIGDGCTVWDMLEDERSRDVLRVASWWSVGMATDQDLVKCNGFARGAVRVASPADAAAYIATSSASSAVKAAADAAYIYPHAEQWQCNELRSLIPDITEYL